MKGLKEKYYSIISLIVIGFLILVSTFMILFLYRAISNSFNIDESLINSQIIKFNLEDFERIKSKLPSSVSQIITNTSPTNTNTTPLNTNVNSNSAGQ